MIYEQPPLEKKGAAPNLLKRGRTAIDQAVAGVRSLFQSNISPSPSAKILPFQRLEANFLDIDLLGDSAPWAQQEERACDGTYDIYLGRWRSGTSD